MVRVLENGEEVKMSKRSGKAITLIDLIDMVGADALRYFYVEKSLNTHMDLDLDLMRKKSSENPVYYAGYAHARIASVFRKFEEMGHTFVAKDGFNIINKDTIKNICTLLIQYPILVKQISENRLVHLMTKYVQDLAYAVHTFYNDEKIITDNMDETLEKLTLLKAAKAVLKDALSLVGVNAPEQM